MKLQFKPETTVILFNQFTFTIIVLLFKWLHLLLEIVKFDICNLQFHNYHCS